MEKNTTIRIRFPDDRDYAGTLEVFSADGTVILGPFPAAGRAHDRRAAAHGNSSRDPLLPYGDTPAGAYAVRGVVESESGPAVVLEPVSGQAALADANGRFRLFIQGGGDDGSLPATTGAVRLRDRDQRQLVGLLRDVSKPIFCEIAPTTERGEKVDLTKPPIDCDPPNVPYVPRPRSAAKFAMRSSTRFVVAPEYSGSSGTAYGGGGGVSDGDASDGGAVGAAASVTADQPVATDAETVSDAGLATPPQDTLAMESVPNTSPLLSAAAPGSTSNASAPPQGGWIAVPPTGELFTNASATGPLASYTGSDVGTYSAAPPDSATPDAAIVNSWTGTPASAPYSDSQNAIQVQAADAQLQAGQASPAAGSSDSTDVTYDGVVYHFTGQGAVNGQIFNTYVDDTGTKWLDLAAGTAPQAPAGAAPPDSSSTAVPGSYTPQRDTTDDPEAAIQEMVTRFAQSDRDLAAAQASLQPPTSPDASETTSPSVPDRTGYGSVSVTGFGAVPGATGSGSVDYPTDSVAASSINAGLAAMRSASTPMSPSGVPLEGPLNLYSESEARALAEAAPEGYMIKDTLYYGPADLAEQTLRVELNIPIGNLPQGAYNAIWGPASRGAVVDATLSGQGVTSYNDLATLSRASIQYQTELPWLRFLGTAAGGLQMVGGAFTIMTALDPNTPAPLVPFAAIGGSFQATGGLAYVVGAWGADGSLMAAGTLTAETGGIIAIPVVVYLGYRAIEYGTWSLADSMATGQIEQNAAAARAGSTTGELPPPYLDSPTGDPLNDFFP